MAQYKTGKVTLAAGSSIVTGVGTAWLANIKIGNVLWLGYGLPMGWIASIDSDTQLTLEAPWSAAGQAGVAYAIVRDFEPQSGAPLLAHGDGGSNDMYNRGIAAVAEFAASGDKTAAVAVAQGSLTSRTLSSRFRDRPTPMDWGAAGDGVTDDTVAIQAAYSAIVAAGGGCLHLAGRVYRVTGPISIYTAVGMTVEGPGTIVVDFKGPGLVAISATNPVTPSTRGAQINIIGLTLKLSTAVQVSGQAPVLFEHLYCSALRLHRCIFDGYGDNTAIRFSDIWNAVFTDCYVWGAGCQRVRKTIPTSTTFTIAAGSQALTASADIFDATDVGQVMCLGSQIMTIQTVTDARNATISKTAVRTTTAGNANFDAARGSMDLGSNILNLNAGVLTTADVGRAVYVLDATLVTYPANMVRPMRATIIAVPSANQAVLSVAATAAVSAVYVIISPAVEVLASNGGTNDAMFSAFQNEYFRGTGMVVESAGNFFLREAKLHASNGSYNAASSTFCGVFTTVGGYIGGDFEGATVNNVGRIAVSALTSGLSFDDVCTVVMDDQPLVAMTSSYAGSVCNIGNVMVGNQADPRSLTTPYVSAGSGILNVWGALAAYARTAPIITNPRAFRQPVSVQPGTLAAPGLSLSGDGDTGLAQIAGANTLSVVAGGAEAIRANASSCEVMQYLGVNVASNLYDRLCIREDGGQRHLLLTTTSDTASAAPYIYTTRQRATGTTTQSGDVLFQLAAWGQTTTPVASNVGLIAVKQTGAATATNVPGAVIISAQPASGVAYATEVVRINGDMSVTHRGNAQTVINANSLHVLRSYTVATLPAASANPWAMAAVSNGASGRPHVTSNGTNWVYPDGTVAA